MNNCMPIGLMLCLLLASGCKRFREHYDATGTFEAKEVVVSAETQGKILGIYFDEGDSLAQGQVAACLDSVQLLFQREQLLATNKAVVSKSIDIATQLAVLQEQIRKQEQEKERFSQLYAHHAATQKQLDDIDAQLNVLKRQQAAQLTTFRQNNAAISDEGRALLAQIGQLSDLITKCRIQSPTGGIVLTKYAEAGEYVAPGKPLFKIGDLKHPYLRAYITSEQLADIRLGQQVAVFSDYGDDKVRRYAGTVTWIGDKSEFTPKSIQTKNERANLVYPVKIVVQNDGFIKIGMYGGVVFNPVD